MKRPQRPKPKYKARNLTRQERAQVTGCEKLRKVFGSGEEKFPSLGIYR